MALLKKIFLKQENHILIEKDLSEPSRLQYNKVRKKSASPHFCNAPFNNMYFSWEGKVIACCFNQTFVLGNYPQQTISEIWNGTAAEQLREAMKDYDLTKGCDVCAHSIKNHQFENTNSLRFDWFKVQKYPTMMEFQLTNTCNLECEMCSGHLSSSIRANREKLPAYPQMYDENFVKQLTEFIPHLQYTTFSGGEPFLIKIYYDIWDEMVAAKSKSIIKVITNGTIYNKRVETLIKKLKFDITVSLDGITKKTYESVRVGSDFEKVMNHIDQFIEYCKVNSTPFNLNYCPMTSNWFEIPEFVDFCNSKKVEFYFCNVEHPFHLSLKSWKGEKLEEVIKSLESFTPPSKTIAEKKNHHSYKHLLENLRLWNT